MLTDQGETCPHLAGKEPVLKECPLEATQAGKQWSWDSYLDSQVNVFPKLLCF